MAARFSPHRRPRSATAITELACCSILLIAPVFAAASAARQAAPADPETAGAGYRGADAGSRTHQPADSADLEGDLRHAVARFELVRRHYLPRVRPGDRPTCRHPVGRFCHWFEHPSPPVKPEPASIAARRRALLSRLGEGARDLPGSGWIAGQRVRYLIEAGLPDSAVAAASACRARGRWCDALAGLALHAAGRDPEAEKAFDGWLSVLPIAERCKVTDLSDLLEGDLWHRFRDLPCPDPRRDEFEQRFWWLADPLYLVPGNERRAEDLSRRVMGRLAAASSTPFHVSWGPDLTELLVRYGWPQWWERRPPDPAVPGSMESVVAHDPAHARSFLPSRDVSANPGSIGPDAWNLSDPEPNASYAVAYADTFVALPHRSVVFRRRDSALVVAAYALVDTGGDGDSVAALLQTADGPDAELGRAQLDRAPRRGVLWIREPARPALLALELLDRPARLAARAREGLDVRPLPAGVPAISGLLAGPLRSSGSTAGRRPTGVRPARRPGTPASREPDPVTAALRLRLAGPGPAAAPRVAPGDSVRLYWELYGLPPGSETYEVEVALRPADASWFEGRGDREPEPTATPYVRLGWTEERSGTSWVTAHRLTVGLPRGMPSGLIAVQVRVVVPGWTALRSRAPILVVRPGQGPPAGGDPRT